MVSSSRVQLMIPIWCMLSGACAEITTCEQGKPVVPEEEFSLLQGGDRPFFNPRHLATGGDAEIDYVVTKDYVQTDAPGLAFRASMDLEDRDPRDSLSLWGSTVRGTPSGTDWLKVGELYLPMRVGGHPVIERDTQASGATLAVTGQQPDAGAENEEAVAEEEEQDDTTEEADAEENGEAAEVEAADDTTEEGVAEAEEAVEVAEQAFAAEAVAEEEEEVAVVEEEAASTEEVATEPEATEAVAAVPEATEEVEVEPEPTEEVMTEPEVTQPEATQPEATQPEATQPEATQPESTQAAVAEGEATEGVAEAEEAVEVAEQAFAAEAVAEEEEEVAVVEEEEAATPEPESTQAVVADGEATELEAAEPTPEPFNGVVVEFGVIFRSFPFLDFKTGTFTTSLALTQRWPADASSYDAAAVGNDENPWNPNLVVTNHDIGGLEVTSTSRTTNETTGIVTQVDYLTIRVLQTFQLKNFPFDSQLLSVHVAPASPGAVSMKLVPIDFLGEPTLDPELLKDHGFQLESVNEEEADLEPEDAPFADPARGVVEVSVGRLASAYFSQLFLPALLVVCVCWSTFFLPVPVAASFATPRTAVTAVAFVAMLVLLLHIEQMVPARFGRMWIDVFAENVAILVFAAVAFNTLEQYVHSHMKRPILASGISRELQIFYPSLSAFVLGFCFCLTGGSTLAALSAFCRFVSFGGIVGYVGATYVRASIVEQGTPRGSPADEGKPRTSLVIRSDDHWRSGSPQ